MDDDDDIIVYVDDTFDEQSRRRSWNRMHPILSKIAFWAVLCLGAAVGVCLFLFFLTIFVYIILPLLLIAAIWLAYKRWQFKRKWRGE